MTILPTTALPCAATDTNGLSPLASYLRGFYCSENGKALHYELVEPVMRGAMSLAIQFPFDPNERVDNNRSQAAPISLLEIVLSLTNVYKNSGTLVAVDWPANINEFSAHLLNDNRVIDTEWVAAALTVAGANPWNELDEAPDTLPRAVVLAAKYGLGGLLRRFLECPGAWDAQKIADFVVPSTTHSGSSELMWSILCTNPHATSSLKVLLEAGARPPGKAATMAAISDGHPEAVEVLSKFDLTPLSENDKVKVNTQWKDRCKRQLITPADLEKMTKAMWGSEHSLALSSEDIEITRFLSTAWKASANGSSAFAYDFFTNKGAAALNSRGVFKGAVSGQWSLLAAAAFSRIKQTDYTGSLGWSVPRMLFQEFDPQESVWDGPDCSKPPFLNSLAPAIGFDWRPGVSIDGIVALSLFGQRNVDDSQTHKKSLESDIINFGLATGVSDPRAWAKASMPAAVEFTVVALKRGSREAVECMMTAWQTALMREPSLVDEISPIDRLRLLGSFTQTTMSFLGIKKSVIQKISSTLFPGLHAKSLFEDSTLRGVELSVALLLTFIHSESKELDKNIEAIFNFSSHFDQGNINTIKQWAEKSEPETHAVWMSHITQWELNQSTLTSTAPSYRSHRL